MSKIRNCDFEKAIGIANNKSNFNNNLEDLDKNFLCN